MILHENGILNYEQSRAWPKLPNDDTLSYKSVDIFDVCGLFIFLLLAWVLSLILLLIEIITFRTSVYKFRKQQQLKRNLLLLKPALHEKYFPLCKQNSMKNIAVQGWFREQ